MTAVLQIFKDYQKKTVDKVPNLTILLEASIKALQNRYLSSMYPFTARLKCRSSFIELYRLHSGNRAFRSHSSHSITRYQIEYSRVPFNCPTVPPERRGQKVTMTTIKLTIDSVVSHLRILMFDEEVEVYLQAKKISEELSKALATGVRNDYRKHKLLPYIQELVSLCKSKSS